MSRTAERTHYVSVYRYPVAWRDMDGLDRKERMQRMATAMMPLVLAHDGVSIWYTLPRNGADTPAWEHFNPDAVLPDSLKAKV